MKRKITKLLIIFTMVVFISSPLSFANSGSEDVFVNLNKKPKNDPDPNKPTNPKENRQPSMPIYCMISQQNGLLCDMIDEEILSYEIWDLDDTICYGLFVNEDEFISYIFNISGNYLIKLQTANYYYYGYVIVY